MAQAAEARAQWDEGSDTALVNLVDDFDAWLAHTGGDYARAIAIGQALRPSAAERGGQLDDRHAFDDDRLACTRAGLSDCLTKPLDPGFLFAVVARALASAGHPTGVGPHSTSPPPRMKGVLGASTRNG